MKHDFCLVQEGSQGLFCVCGLMRIVIAIPGKHGQYHFWYVLDDHPVFDTTKPHVAQQIDNGPCHGPPELIISALGLQIENPAYKEWLLSNTATGQDYKALKAWMDYSTELMLKALAIDPAEYDIEWGSTKTSHPPCKS